MVLWNKTYLKRPLDPQVVLPVFLLTVAALEVHMAEEYLTGFGPAMSRLFDIGWTERSFLMVFAFIGPALYALTALGLYYRVPLGVSLSRILTGRTELKFYEAGMDLGLSTDRNESFKLFQQRIVDEYDGMVAEFGLTVMDATLPIPEQQRRMRDLVRPYLQGIHRHHTAHLPSLMHGVNGTGR